MAKTCRKWKINLHYYSYNIRYCWTVWLTKNSRVCYLVYELQTINFHCRHFSQRMVKNKSKGLHHPSSPCLRVAQPLCFHPSIIKSTLLHRPMVNFYKTTVSRTRKRYSSQFSHREPQILQTCWFPHLSLHQNVLVLIGVCKLSSSSALQPWVGLGLLGSVYYFFKNLSVQ